MTRLTHAELAAAYDRQDWPLLWEQAVPLVKLAVGRLTRGWASRDEDANDDMRQEGMLIAGQAMRTWNALECAYSTHIVNRVRGDLMDYQYKKMNGGIGGKDQSPVVLSLFEQREDAPVTEDEDEEDDGTFEAALSYDGVIKPGGQFSGLGTAPEGYGEPSEEADRLQRDEAVQAVVEGIRDLEERSAVRCVFGIGVKVETAEAYAARTEIPVSTVYRWLDSARKKLRIKLSNARSY